jgi:hypothetical protein
MFACCILRLRVLAGLNMHDVQNVSFSDSRP